MPAVAADAFGVDDAADMPEGKLERVTHAAFGQRRKMLRQSVKSLGGEALLMEAGIDPARRAETLSVEEFVRLANCL
jgi:16S rRNA (adenine1518-N6/adenine1519-N6)-dimethyltransferase